MTVEVTVSNSVGQVILNRPEVMNAISIELATSLERALIELGANPEVRVIVVRGAGGNFCAGGDIAEVQRLVAEGPDALDTLFAAFRQACAAVQAVPQPVVAVVEGVAMAGGFELVQAVDVAVARDDARLSDHHANHGMVPGGGGSQRLPRLIGRGRALAHLLTGERLTGAEAARLGVVFRSFPADQLASGVEGIVAGLAAKDPAALSTIKRLVHDGLDRSLEQGLDLEQRTVVNHIMRQGDDAFAGRSSR